MGEQLPYIHCWDVPQVSRSRPPASTDTLRYTPPVNVGNCTYLWPCSAMHMLRLTERIHENEYNLVGRAKLAALLLSYFSPSANCQSMTAAIEAPA